MRGSPIIACSNFFNLLKLLPSSAQAQAQAQLGAEIALISSNTPTHPPPTRTSSKKIEYQHSLAWGTRSLATSLILTAVGTCSCLVFTTCSHFVYDLFMTCSWLVHDLFINLFMTCLWLVYDLLWLVHDLFMTCSWPVHDLFMTCLQLVHNLFMTYSWLVH